MEPRTDLSASPCLRYEPETRTITRFAFENPELGWVELKWDENMEGCSYFLVRLNVCVFGPDVVFCVGSADAPLPDGYPADSFGLILVDEYRTEFQTSSQLWEGGPMEDSLEDFPIADGDTVLFKVDIDGRSFMGKKVTQTSIAEIDLQSGWYVFKEGFEAHPPLSAYLGLCAEDSSVSILDYEWEHPASLLVKSAAKTS